MVIPVDVRKPFGILKKRKVHRLQLCLFMEKGWARERNSELFFCHWRSSILICKAASSSGSTTSIINMIRMYSIKSVLATRSACFIISMYVVSKQMTLWRLVKFKKPVTWCFAVSRGIGWSKIIDCSNFF